MATEILRKYSSGFFLTEQELRRTFQEMLDHAKKAQVNEVSHEITVVLQNGAVLEMDLIDEIFALENLGQKGVRKISLEFKSANKEEKNWSYWLIIEEPPDFGGYYPISFYAFGPSRDWVFVGVSDMEDRVSKIKRWSIIQLIKGRAAFFVGVALAPISMIGSMAIFGKSKDYLILQQEYDAGKLKDPVLAMIELEKLRQSSFTGDFLQLMLSSFAPLLCILLLSMAIPYFYPAYNFYWGDYIERYKKRRRISAFFWGVVILGILLSVAGNFASKKLGI